MFLASAAATLSLVAPAYAFDGVVASIKPVHSLVSAVMDGVGEPTLIVRSTGSEHAYSLRPSDARAIEQATVIFWVGPGMETFLDNSIETLGGDATVVAMENTPGLEKLAYREGGPFEAHSHGDDDHDHGHDHDHAHGEYDLHFWLDPLNAKAMLSEIERTLSAADPDNAERYRENAAAYAGQLDALVAEIEAQIAPVKDSPSIVFHDAYQYFEQRFGINVAGSITVSPEVLPGAQRVADIKAKVQELGAACVFSEPQFEPRLVSVVTEGTTARTGVLDPLGADIEDGPDLYPQLMRNMATSFATCLADPS
jgi:zinc transport system substrate-binding protein